MARKAHIAVLLGGTSPEREVSLESGKACIAALERKGYHVTAIDPGDDLREFIDVISDCSPDKVFNALHGCPGEDGVFQAILDYLKIPYTHSGVSASSVAMHKGFARSIFAAEGIPIAEGFSLSLAEARARLRRGDIFLPLPFVLKPLSQGSSVGVHIIESMAQLPAILADWEHGDILLENYIAGHELTVSVMGDKALEVTELITESGFYDFAAKYTEGKTVHICPAEIDEDLRRRCMDYAVRAHRALRCRTVSRSDFRYDPQNDMLILLEVNTQPGMTRLSLVPEQARYLGIAFDDLCEWILNYE